jgi:hypothetical protein
MRKLALFAALVGIGGFGLAAGVPAAAQTIQLGPGGVEVSPGRPDFRIDRHEAVRIARDHGMDEVNDTDRDRGVWTIRGRDRHGDRMRIVISARSGRVIDIDRHRHHDYEDD